MTKDDIIHMAHEAGLHIATDVHWMPIIGLKYVEKLIALAVAHGAAAEREKVAKWMMQHSYATGHGDTIEDLLNELEWQVRESERNVIADAVSKCDSRATPKGIAAAIRARGQG